MDLLLADWLDQCTFPMEAKYADMEFAKPAYDAFVDDMIANVDKVVVENTDAVNEVLGNFNSVDFNELNSAIKDLGDVVEPLAKFFGAFK